MKKKKNTDDNVRCQLNTLASMSSADKRLLKKMSKCTKNIYNSSLYCYKRWYDVHEIIVKKFADNIDEHLTSFSPEDRLILGKYFKKNGNIEKLCMLLKYSHKSEKELAGLLESDEIIIQTLPIKQKSELNTFEYTRDCIESITQDDINEKYSFIVDESKSLQAVEQITQYQDSIKHAITHKIENRKPVIEEEENTTEENTTKKKTTKKKVQKTIKVFNLIPTSTPCFDIINTYVTNNCSSYRHVSSQTAQQTIHKLLAKFQSFC